MRSPSKLPAPGRGEVRRRGLMANYIEFAASAVLGSLVALVATSHLARALQVEAFGQFSLVRTFSEYAILFSTLGIRRLPRVQSRPGPKPATLSPCA